MVERLTVGPGWRHLYIGNRGPYRNAFGIAFRKLGAGALRRKVRAIASGSKVYDAGKNRKRKEKDDSKNN